MLSAQFDLLFVSLLAGVGGAAFRLLAPALRRRYASRALCAVWLALALWLVLPVHVTLRRAPLRLTVPSAVAERLDRQAAGLLIFDAAPAPDSPRAPAVPGSPADAQTAGSALNPAAPAAPAAPAPPALTLRQWLALLWGAGAALIAVYQLAAYLWWRRTVRRWDTPAPPALRRCNELAAARVGVRPLPVFENAALCAPVLAGLLRPVVRVPAGFAPPADAAPDATAAYWALCHEYTHRRRRDLAKKLLLQAAVCLHWFNPLVWLLRAGAQQELEYACDETVLQNATAAQRSIYGGALLHAAGAQPGRALRPVPVSHFGGGKRAVKHRLANLFLQNKRRGAALALGCVAALGGCAALVARAGPEQAAARRLAREDAALAEPFLEWLFRCEPAGRDSKNRTLCFLLSSADPADTIQRLYYDEIGELVSVEGLAELRRLNLPSRYEALLTFAGYSAVFERVELTPTDRTQNQRPWESDCYAFTAHLTVTQNEASASLASDTAPAERIAHPATVTGQLFFEGEAGMRRICGLYLGEEDGWLPPDAADVQQPTPEALKALQDSAAGTPAPGDMPDDAQALFDGVAQDYEQFLQSVLRGGQPPDLAALAAVERMDPSEALKTARSHMEQQLAGAGNVYAASRILSVRSVAPGEYGTTGLEFDAPAGEYGLDDTGTLKNWLLANPAQIVRVRYSVEYSPEYLTRGPEFPDGSRTVYLFVTPAGVQGVAQGAFGPELGAAVPEQQGEAWSLGLSQREYLYLTHLLEALTAAGLTDFAVQPGQEAALPAMLQAAAAQMTDAQLCRYLLARGAYFEYGQTADAPADWLAQSASAAAAILLLDFTPSESANLPPLAPELTERLTFSAGQQTQYQAEASPAAVDGWEFAADGSTITAYALRDGVRVQQYTFARQRDANANFTLFNRVICTGGQALP